MNTRALSRIARSALCGALLISTCTLRAEPPAVQNRCGWFDNPSPGNATLADRDGEWTIAIQGGHQAAGEWPRFKPGQWVRTGVGSYGYGCACMRVTVDAETQEIEQIHSSIAKPLAACRRDRTLQEPENPLKQKR